MATRSTVIHVVDGDVLTKEKEENKKLLSRYSNARNEGLIRNTCTYKEGKRCRERKVW